MTDDKHAAGGRKVFTVSALTEEIKSLLEGAFPGLWVEGEISNLRVYPSGHAYFTLKDDKAQLRAVMWKGNRAHLKFEPKDGDHVVCRGRVSVYDKRGEYQIIVDAMEPKGLGALQAAFEMLKKKLAGEGLFDEERKKPLPFIPWSVGIVTSPKGAAVRDMVRTINRRFPGLRIVLNPAQVQGEGAAEQIAAAIGEFNEYGQVDVLIVGRGGGSIEDLWAFNEEVVARAIAASRIPVVSAVGHETDFTIADFVADLRASTPTAAAEQVAPERAAVEESIDDLERRMVMELRGTAESLAQRVDDLGDRATRAITSGLDIAGRLLDGALRHLGALSPRTLAKMRRERLRELVQRAARGLRGVADAKRAGAARRIGHMGAIQPGRWTALRRERTDRNRAELVNRLRETVLSLRKRSGVAEGRLDAFSPLKVLERGYSIVTGPDGKRVIRSVAELTRGDRVRIRMRDGDTGAVIENGKPARQQKLF